MYNENFYKGEFERRIDKMREEHIDIEEKKEQFYDKSSFFRTGLRLYDFFLYLTYRFYITRDVHTIKIDKNKKNEKIA